MSGIGKGHPWVALMVTQGAVESVRAAARDMSRCPSSPSKSSLTNPDQRRAALVIRLAADFLPAARAASRLADEVPRQRTHT